MAGSHQIAYALRLIAFASLAAFCGWIFPVMVRAVACTVGGSQTTVLTLCKPASGETGWATYINANWDAIDALFQGTGQLRVTKGGTGLGTGGTAGNVLASDGTNWLSTTNVRGFTDTNSAVWLQQVATTTAVNAAMLYNAQTGRGPALVATGSDTNISIRVLPKGSGGVTVDNNYIENTAMTAPSAPGQNGARIYATTTGGKVTLCAIFPTGAAQCFATQP